MKTRTQKETQVQEIKQAIQGSKGFILAGFTGIPVNALTALRAGIREGAGEMSVVNRRMLMRALNETGIDMEVPSFLGQTAFIPYQEELVGVAGVVNDTMKTQDMELLGGYDTTEQRVLALDYITRVAQLPPREMMIAQTVGAIAAPIRAFLYALQQIQKVGSNS